MINSRTNWIKWLILGCGLQQKGFKIPDGDKLQFDEFDLTFIEIDNAKYSLEYFDGVVIASGAFEHIEVKDNYLDGTYYDIQYNRSAVRMNVTILRTIDLLLFMKTMEAQSRTARRDMLTNWIAKGGGWLKFVDGQLVLLNT